MHSQRKIYSYGLLKTAYLAGLIVLVGFLPTNAFAGDGLHKYQTSNIVDFHTGVPVDGAATLFRSENSANAQVHTRGLHKKSAYSIWWVIWNDPGECVGGCGEDDLEIEGNGIVYAGGFVTGNDGSANVSVSLQAGPLAEGVEDLLGYGGLAEDNGLVAEMHLVIRSHGKTIPGMVDVQVGSFDGACDINKCLDHQAVVFLP